MKNSLKENRLYGQNSYKKDDDYSNHQNLNLNEFIKRLVLFGAAISGIYLQIKTKLDPRSFDQEIDILKKRLSLNKAQLIEHKTSKKVVEAELEKLIGYYNICILICEWALYCIDLYRAYVTIVHDFLWIVIHVRVYFEGSMLYSLGRFHLESLVRLLRTKLFADIFVPFLQATHLEGSYDLEKSLNNQKDSLKDSFENKKNIFDNALLSINKVIEIYESEIFDLESKLKELDVPLEELKELIYST